MGPRLSPSAMAPSAAHQRLQRDGSPGVAQGITAAALLTLAPVLAALPAWANPARYGQQLCVMLNSGISQSRAWDYIVRDHTQAALGQPSVVVPWSSSGSAGLALGLGLGRLEQAHKELDAMKSDVFKVARSTCPQRFR